MEVDVRIDSLEELKIIKPTMTTKDKYREAMDALQRVYNSNKNNKYGERLMKAVDKVNKLEQQYRKENE